MESGGVVLSVARRNLHRLVATMSLVQWLVGCGALVGGFEDRLPRDGVAEHSDSGPDVSDFADRAETSDVDADAAHDVTDGPDARAETSDMDADASRDATDGPDERDDPEVSCSGTSEQCACTAESCTAVGQRCNSMTGRCEPLADFYVDAAATTEGNGALAAPFRTITKAIQAAASAQSASDGTAKRISVAAGRYDQALGEVFPLILRGAVSLQGAGADRTVIAGSGDLNHGAEGGSWNITLQPTIVAGDSAANIEISALTILPDGKPPVYGHIGVWCDRGGATQGATTTSGVTWLHDVTVGPAYFYGVLAATSTAPTSGCHLKVTSSRLLGNYQAIHGEGCARGVGRVPVVMEVGDSTSGNVFEDNQDFTLIAGACVSRMVVQNNTFSRGGWGIAIDERLDTGDKSQYAFAIKNNAITKCSVAGISIIGVPLIDEMTNNQVTDNSAPWNAEIGGIGLTMGGDASQPLSQPFPRIAKARGNQFIGNDVGVQIGMLGVTDFNAGNPPSDFGNAIEPGNNVFRCNASPRGGGFDVKIEATGSGTIPFRGNEWDHDPPTAQVLGSFANGADLLQPASSIPAIDTTGATAKAIVCPAGRVAGP
jgi:hypothetical protein